MVDNALQSEKVPTMENPDASTGNLLYPEMIMAAVRALNEPNGSSKEAICNYIESNHPNVRPSHSTLLLHHLHLLKEDGSLVMEKHCYKVPSDSQGSEPISAPAKQGRGRPPKPQIAVLAGGPPQPRGRPPKPKVGVPAGGPSRRRGRPPKPKVRVPAGGGSRPRGRPSKPKVGVPAGGPSRPRGRPPKPTIEVPAAGSPRPRGRRRGRPPKPKVGVLSPGESPSSRGRPTKKPKVGGEATGAPLPQSPPKVAGTAAVPAGGTPSPRAKPPKPKDPTKLSVPPLRKYSRSRGRPAEVPAVVEVATVPAAGSPRPRGRGRPPKPKIGALSPGESPSSRGRPTKKLKVEAEATGAPPPQGPPGKVAGTAALPAGATPRPRGRPPNPKDPTKPSVSPLPKGSRTRGRPPKAKPAEVPAVVEVATTVELPSWKQRLFTLSVRVAPHVPVTITGTCR
ncbi:uncharacterized protein LOC116259370 isoform X2 [Nymphaea colorata]|uniref:uncharacterized protein LOC116259370 isoform X2 n=1 Tax=Nymphaea colorata TaxID=210225 RepID=UPI00214E948D|nr:uncharacterized protein LOC116259370 isoform X2 [Nymphaea colorata]